MIIRRSTPADQAALERVAALDSAPALHGDALVAEVDGDIRAAVSLTDGRVIANPFVRTAELVDLLELRAAQLTEPCDPRSGRTRLLPGRAAAQA